MKKSVKIIGFFLLLTFVLMFISSIFAQEALTNTINKEIEAYGLIFVFVIVALLEIVPQYIGPHIIMIESNILGFSLFMNTITVIVGSFLGSLIGYETGQKYGFKIVKRFYEKFKIKNIENIVNNRGKWIVTIAAISPLPYVPLIFGSLNMSRKNFTIYGLMPRLISFIILALIILMFN